MASPVAEHGLQGFRAPKLWGTGLVASRHVEYSRTRGSNPCSPQSIGKQTPATGPPEKSWTYVFISLGYMPRVGIAGSCGNFVFNQFKKIILISCKSGRGAGRPLDEWERGVSVIHHGDAGEALEEVASWAYLGI